MKAFADLFAFCNSAYRKCNSCSHRSNMADRAVKVTVNIKRSMHLHIGVYERLVDVLPFLSKEHHETQMSKRERYFGNTEKNAEVKGDVTIRTWEGTTVLYTAGSLSYSVISSRYNGRSGSVLVIMSSSESSSNEINRSSVFCSSLQCPGEQR